MRRVAIVFGLALLAGCGENLTPPPAPAPYQPTPVEAPSCVPNLDGRIDADELPVALGIAASFLVSPAGVERQVDLVGQVDPDGRRVWDWAVDLADDQGWQLEARPLAGRWYETDFPGGELVVPYDPGGRLENVYRKDDQALWLLGLASAEPDPPEGRTLLVYTEPVALFRFPIAPGAEHVSVGELRDGTLQGLPYAGRDVYEVSVAAAGELRLPDLTFSQAHEVLVHVVNEPAVGQAISQRQAIFVFECYGEVARAVARLDEPEATFTVARELRRIGLRPPAGAGP